MAPPKKGHTGKRAQAAQRLEEKRLEKQEKDKLICYRYARCRNASRVATEYGVNRMYVTRAWGRLSDDEREALLDVREQVDEELNRQIIRAEAIGGDKFVANIVRARELLGNELIRRCTGSAIREISDRDLTSLLRIMAGITAPDNPDKNAPEEDTLSRWRNTINEEIGNK